MVEASFYNTDGKNILIEISDDGMGIQRRTPIRESSNVFTY